MSNTNVEAMPVAAQPRGYDRSRLNALGHGILARQLVLPSEDRDEFDASMRRWPQSMSQTV